jgi:hypothetical protein
MKNKEYYIRLGEAVQKLEEKNCPTDPSKWSYYKSQAKEKFDVYPSAYANGWASKQYGDAGGGWKKCASEATDSEEKDFHMKLDKLVHSTFGMSPDEKKEKNKSVNEAKPQFIKVKDTHQSLANGAMKHMDSFVKKIQKGIQNGEKFEISTIVKMRNILDAIENKYGIKESTPDQVIKDLDKAKNDLLKKVDALIAKKKKLYSNVDIEAPMSADEKKLDKDIADLFSQINKLVLQKRSVKKESVNEKFDNTHLGLLKYAYKDIDKINPADPMYKRVVVMLDKLSKQELKQIADADIKFLSLLAKNRLMKTEGDEMNDPQEITVGDYKTRYFDVCPGASNLYKDIESKGVDMNMAVRSAKLQDVLFFIEKHIQRPGYNPSPEYLFAAKNIANEIMKLAKMMNLESEHNYIQGHIDTIAKVVGGESVNEASVSQQQQKIFGLALAVKRGEVPRSEASQEVLDIVDSMSEKDIRDFAATKHSNLPKKVESVNESSVEIGDFVFLKSANKIATVIDRMGRSVTVRTADGKKIKTIINNIKTLAQDNVNEGNAFTGALFKARKEGLTEFEFNGKMYPVHKLEEEEETPIKESKLSKNDLKKIIKEEYHNVKNFMEEQYGFVPEFGKVYSNLAAKPFLKEEEEEVVEEYDVENYQDLKEFVQFMAEYKADINEAEYQGRKVKLGKIMQGDTKKFKVYVKNDKGNVVKVNFGQGGDAKGGTMRIRKDNPKARASFRARHNCDNPGPRWKARYWSCRKW